MTTPVSAATGTNPAAAAAAPASGLGGLGKDAFLKLLVAQLKYQNPMSPTDPTTFLSQSAQFSMVEKLAELVDQGSIRQASDAALAAASLVGRKIAWDDGLGTGALARGTVSSVHLDRPGGPLLAVGSRLVPISSVVQIDA
jgi:flagellar basal-body rod modification protein FlgD